MSPLLLARVLPAVALLPLGTLPVRLFLGVGAAFFLAPHVPISIDFSIAALLTEVAIGATLGLLAGLPLHAASALEANGPAFGHAGRTFAWAIFFAVGGPVLWLVALGKSFTALPPGLEISLIEGGAGLFYAALLLGLPAWLTALILGPLAGFADRLGLAWHSGPLLALRPFITLLLLLALLPLLLDVLRELWLEALHG